MLEKEPRRVGYCLSLTGPQVVQVQYQGIDRYDAGHFKDGAKQVVVAPGNMASGQLIYPYADAL